MQNPGQPSPYRRAGDSAGSSGSPDGNLKDWQKNTWFGPAPTNPNPFEEPENAPELLESRSSNVNNHTGRFWNDQEATGYQYSTDQIRKQTSRGAAGAGKKKNEERMISLRAVGILLALLLAAALVLFFVVFQIREIRVIGNKTIPAPEVIRLSGIKGGSILTLSEDTVAKNIEEGIGGAADRTGNYNFYRLQFRYIEKELPGTVIICVREREACCVLTLNGILYVTDKNCKVLWESEDLGKKAEMADLVEVKGLDIRSGTNVGQTLALSSEQAPVFRNLFTEMKVQGLTGEIREADLSNLSSILLTTRDNFTVSLGDSRNIHAKLRSMMLVRAKLLEMGKTSGSIDVSNPETPSYSPSAPQ